MPLRDRIPQSILSRANKRSRTSIPIKSVKMVKEGVNVPKYLNEVVSEAVSDIPDDLSQLDVNKLPTGI